MAFVLDASVALCWAMDDEVAAPAAVRALRLLETEDAYVPALWWFEIRNALISNERRQRLREAASTAFLHRLGQLAIRIDRDPQNDLLLSLARRHRLTVYDAAYLELAQRAGAPLATLDSSLIRAARGEGVPLVGA